MLGTFIKICHCQNSTVVGCAMPAVTRQCTCCYRASSIVWKYIIIISCTRASRYNEQKQYTVATLQREEERQSPTTWQLLSEYRTNVLDVQQAFRTTGNIRQDTPMKLATATTSNTISKPKCLSDVFAASLDSETDKGCWWRPVQECSPTDARPCEESSY